MTLTIDALREAVAYIPPFPVAKIYMSPRAFAFIKSEVPAAVSAEGSLWAHAFAQEHAYLTGTKWIAVDSNGDVVKQGGEW